MPNSAVIPYATLATIQSASWSLTTDFTAGGGAGSGLGRVQQGISDIEQCLQIIFTTIPGEDPYRPGFGCDLTRFMDLPLPAAIPAIVAEVSRAISAWEPRITLVGVQLLPLDPANPGRLRVAVTWEPALGLSAAAPYAIGQQTTVLTTTGGAPSQ